MTVSPTIVLQEMTIGSLPDILRDGGRVVKSHSHSLLLRSLTSEHVGDGGLVNLGRTFDNLKSTNQQAARLSIR
jgi:hypothetical protein